jgi:hypothetical protein
MVILPFMDDGERRRTGKAPLADLGMTMRIIPSEGDPPRWRDDLGVTPHVTANLISIIKGLIVHQMS